MLPSEEIKQKINIVDLIGEYIELKKAGTNFRALCPFHQEKTPSFMVSPTKQIWHCFGCGLGGDIFEFVKQREAVEFPEALQILASRTGVVLERPTVEYQKQADEKRTLYAINDLAAKFYVKVLADSSVAQMARDYLLKRGFRPETLRTWQLGYAPEDFHLFESFITKKGFQKSEAVRAGLLVEKDGQSFEKTQDGFFDRFRGRLMFPLFDIHGRVAGFTGRILAEAEGIAKYLNSPETPIYSKSQLLYGLHLAKTEIRKHDEVIVVEGNVDVITCHEAGFRNVVGSSGTALAASQLLTLKRFTDNIKFAFDVDAAGLNATRRAVELALSLGFNIKIIAIPKALAKDPDELIRRSPALWQEQTASAKNFLDFYFAAIFANLNLESSVEKKRAAAELLSLLALLPDPLDRAHYLQKLARELGVDEKILLPLLNQNLSSHGKPANQIVSSQPYAIRKTKQEILERRVLGLFLKFSKDLPGKWEILEVQDFTTPLLQEIFAAVSPLMASGNFELQPFLADNSKLAPEIELLIFAVENELSFGPEWNLEDLQKQFLGALKEASLKRQMQMLTQQIKQAELRGRLKEAKLLSSEFNNLTRELAKYYVP